MGHEQLIEAFPRRAIAIRKPAGHDKARRKWLIILLLLFLPGLYWGWSLWREQQLHQFLRTHGVETEVIDSEGSCWSRRGITGDQPRGCRLDISYQVKPEHGGGVRQANVWLDGREPVFTPPALYDPGDPSRVMLRPEAERDLRWSEWIGVPFALAIPFAGLMLWWFARKHQLEDAAKTPRPATVPVERMAREGNLINVWFRPGEGQKPLLHVFPAGRTPFLLHSPSGDPDDPPWALALLTPRGRPVLLDSELAELELTADERTRLLGTG